MNRRHFFMRSTAVASGVTATSLVNAGTMHGAIAKVLIPPTEAKDLADLRAAAPSLELLACRDQDEADARVSDAAAAYGFITRPLIQNGVNLRWVQQPSAGVETVVTIRELRDRPIVLTNK